jgi:hypothetical protein
MSLLEFLLGSDRLEKGSQESSPSSPSSPTCPAHGSQPPIGAACFLGKPQNFSRSHGDAYGSRLQLALQAICDTNAPEGLIVWLAGHSPHLYRLLTEKLPEEISRAWDSQTPFAQFEVLCSELVQTYRTAAALYRTNRRSASGERGSGPES